MEIIPIIFWFLRKEKCSYLIHKMSHQTSTALLPFIMDLIYYDSVVEFLQNTPMDGKFCRRSLSEWHSSRVEQ